MGRYSDYLLRPRKPAGDAPESLSGSYRSGIWLSVHPDIDAETEVGFTLPRVALLHYMLNCMVHLVPSFVMSGKETPFYTTPTRCPLRFTVLDRLPYQVVSPAVPFRRFATEPARYRHSGYWHLKEAFHFKLVQRVERQLVRPGTVLWDACCRLCMNARKIGNCATYIMRHDKVRPTSGTKLAELVRERYPSLFDGINATAGQRQCMYIYEQWVSYRKALVEYKKHPEKFKARPRRPGYKNKYRTFFQATNGFAVHDGLLQISRGCESNIPLIPVTAVKDQPYNMSHTQNPLSAGLLRVVPLGNTFAVELTYQTYAAIGLGSHPKSNSQDKLSVKTFFITPDRRCAIDLGVENFLTVVPMQAGSPAILIKGGILKSVNHKHNKAYAELQQADDRTRKQYAQDVRAGKPARKPNRKLRHMDAKSDKRNNRVNDFLHKVSAMIVDYCLHYAIGTLIIGFNRGIKQRSRLGRVNNQNFVQMPHARLIRLIAYKAEARGIKVVETEESYTSKASALDFDPLPVYGADKGRKHTFSGRRVSRGRYRRKGENIVGPKILSADVNGSLNIARKVLGDGWLQKAMTDQSYRGLLERPVAVSPLETPFWR